jgi:hypothetical protein
LNCHSSSSLLLPFQFTNSNFILFHQNLLHPSIHQKKKKESDPPAYHTWKQSCGTVVPKIPFASSMGKGALTDEPDAVDRH